MREAEGVADGHDPVADLDRVGVAEGDAARRRSFFHAQHRQIGAGVGADHLGSELAVVEQLHAQRRGDHGGMARGGCIAFFEACDHVVVGEHGALGVDEEAGAHALQDGLAAVEGAVLVALGGGAAAGHV